MWSYKVLLVQAGRGASPEARILLAADLADRFEATLIGLAADPLASADDMLSAEGRFHAVSNRAARHREWRSFAMPLAAALAREARAADLLILGAELDGQPNSAEIIAGQFGRPILLVPDRARMLDASRVLIAWSDTPEARRAVTAALPFLSLAERVEIMATRDAPPGDGRMGDDLSDLVLYLSRHGVPAEAVRHAPAEGCWAIRIALAAQELGADLVVAGASAMSRPPGTERCDVPYGRANPLHQCWLLSD